MLRNLKDLENYKISATDGDIGRVKDFYFDDQAWVIRYLIVDTGSWLVSRKVLISPISMLKPDWTTHMLPVAITLKQVENSPAVDTDKPVSRQHEMQYLDYYGYTSYWGGAGMWGEGMYPFAMVSGGAGASGALNGRDMAIEEAQRAERAKHRDDDPHLRSCEAVVGYRLHATDGELGSVEGFLVDDETWAIRYLVVNTSHWWLGNKVLIAPQWIQGVHWSDETVTVDLSRAAVKAAPRYYAPVELDRKGETDLYTHYGRPPYWAHSATLEREI